MRSTSDAASLVRLCLRVRTVLRLLTKRFLMFARLALAVLGLASSLTFARASGWETLPPLPEPAAGFAAGCVNGKIVIAGGTNWRSGVKRWLGHVWLFDPATGRWTVGPALPHAVAYAAFVSDGTRLYFAGGGDGKQGRREVYALDDALKLTRLGALSQPVVFGGGALRDGHLLVFGGTPDPDDWTKGSNRLDAIPLTTGATTPLAALQAVPNAIGLPAVAAMGSRFYIFTGAWMDANKQAHNATAAFQHDAASNTWTPLADYPEAIRGVAAVSLDEHRIYLAGGYSSVSTGFVAKAWIYHLRTDRYSPATPLPLAVCTTFVKSGEFIFLLGGEHQMRHRSAACWRIRIRDLLAGKP